MAKKKEAKMGQAIRKGIRKQAYKYSKSRNSAYHWSYVLRAPKSAQRELIAIGMEKAVKCGKIRYSNESDSNAKLYDDVRKLHFDCSKLRKRTYTNCCNLVSVCCRYAGIDTPRKSTARTMAQKWQKYGLKCHKFTGKNLKRGDILVDCTEPKVHTAVYLGRK